MKKRNLPVLLALFLTFKIVASMHDEQSLDSVHETFAATIEVHTVNGTSDSPKHVLIPPKAEVLFEIGGSTRLEVKYVEFRSFRELFQATSTLDDALLLDNLFSRAPGGQVELSDVQFICNTCEDVESLQRRACTDTLETEVLDFEISPGLFHVLSWGWAQNFPVQMRNVKFSCDSNLSLTNASQLDPKAAVAHSSGYLLPAQLLEPPPMACAVAHVSNWSQLLYATQDLQQFAQRVHVVLHGNITVPLNYNRVDNGTMLVYRHVKVVAGRLSQALLTVLQLGSVRGEGLWTIYDDNSSITFTGITILAPPLGPADKYPTSVIPWGIWAVSSDRCRSDELATTILVNCTLVTTLETMQYSSHWAAELLSPFADKRRDAAWYGVDPTCNPPRNRTLLQQQIDLLDQYTWVAEEAVTHGVRLNRTVITNSLEGLSTEGLGLPLTKMFSDPFVPFPSIAWVRNAPEFVSALINGTTPYILVLSNISVSPDLWQQAAEEQGQQLALRRNVEIAGWPGRACVIDWQGATNIISLGSNTAKLRNLVMMNGGQGRPGFHPSWAVNLTFYQWPFNYTRIEGQLSLQSVTIVVPSQEFDLLLGDHKSGESLSRLGGVTWIEKAVLQNPGRTALVPLLVDDGIFGNNVVITKEPVAFPKLEYDIRLDDVRVGGSPPPGTGSSSSSAWRVAVAVSVATVGALLLITGAIVLVRRHQGIDKAGDLPPGYSDGARDHLKSTASDLEKGSGVSTPFMSGAGAQSGAPGFKSAASGRTTPGSIGGMNGMVDAWPMHDMPGAVAGAPDGHDPGSFLTPAFHDTPLGTPFPMSHSSSRTPFVDSAMEQQSGSQGQASMLAGMAHQQQRYGSLYQAGYTTPNLGGAQQQLPQTSKYSTPLHWPAQHPEGPNQGFVGGPMVGQGQVHHQMSGSVQSAGSVGHSHMGNGHSQIAGCSGQSSRQMASHSFNSNSATQPGARFGTSVGPFNSMGAFDRTSGAIPSSASSTRGVMEAEGGDTYVDSFDRVPQDHEQLLINRMEMSKELQASIFTPDVAHQLKAMVTRLQSELGDQEVEITRVIGQGGGGVVYMGTWRGLTVAVKTLVFTVLPHQPMSRSQHRAMTEAAICRTLHHPNIVSTYAYDLHELSSARPLKGASSSANMAHSSDTSSSGPTDPYIPKVRAGGQDPPAPIENVNTATEFKLAIIQEYCDGGTLKAAVDDGKLHEATGSMQGRPAMAVVLQLAVDAAAGMAHVHSRNIVHGDLTPANVLLKITETTESRFLAKVADFGLSWKLSNGQQHVSNARQGTGFYIAPEVLHVGIMSKSADVFSFGMILHEMYHGTPPWRRPGRRDFIAAASAAMQRPGLDQLVWADHCPPELRSLISDCLASDPQARPSFFVIVEKLLAMQRELKDLKASAQQVVDTANTVEEEGQATEVKLEVDEASIEGRDVPAVEASGEAGNEGSAPDQSPQSGVSVMKATQ